MALLTFSNQTCCVKRSASFSREHGACTSQLMRRSPSRCKAGVSCVCVNRMRAQVNRETAVQQVTRRTLNSPLCNVMIRRVRDWALKCAFANPSQG